MKKFSRMAICALFLLSAFTVSAQLKVPAPSPFQSIEQAFGLSTIKIEYSRPSVKDRTIYGDLVPYGKVWRTGANASTKVTFGDDVKVEGKPLAAGTYAMYTMPGKDKWDIMFYKDLSLGGNVAEYKAENEVLRVQVAPKQMADKVETFTIDIANVTANTADIQLVWEKTRVSIGLSADIDSKIMKNIEASVEKDTRPYYQAASYYYENDKDMAKALTWVNKALEQNPKAFWVAHLKAKIQMKAKDYKGAIASAEKSKEMAKEAQNDDYVKLNDKLIAEAKKAK